MTTFTALPLLDAKGRHIRVDPLARRMAGRPNRRSVIATKLLAVDQSAQLSAQLGLPRNILALPKAPFQYAFCAFASFAAGDCLLPAIMPRERRHV